jgi:hypothetical protein
VTDLIQSIALVILAFGLLGIVFGAKRKINALEDKQEQLEEELRQLRQLK